MKKHKRHKLNLRPKAGNPEKTEDSTPETKAEEAMREMAHQLYTERGGEAIDRAIKRMERLLELHDREAEKLMTSEVANYRWQVSPSMVIRLQREVEREEERRQQLREECWSIAQRMIAQWMEDRDARETAQRGEFRRPDIHVVTDGNGIDGATPERSPADAHSRAG